MFYFLKQHLKPLNEYVLELIQLISIISLGFILSLHSNAQQPEQKKKIGISFVKTFSEQSSDSLYFNVIKIQNLTNEIQNLDIEFQLPDVFTLLTNIPAKIIIKPNGHSNIAFRVSISKSAISSHKYELKALIKSALGESLTQATAELLIKTHREWELLNLVSELNVITGNDSESPFLVPIRNNGNVTEKVNLQLTPPEGFIIKNGKRTVDQISFSLSAGKDTSISFNLLRKGKEKLSRSESQLQIKAYNTLGEFRKSIRINSYTSRFEYVQEKINLDNFVEVSHQVNLPNAQNREAFQARGKIPFEKKGSEIQYSFMNYDMTNSDDFWNRSYYNLNYSGKRANYGIGQSYSSLGVDLYNNHGIFGDYKLDMNTTNQLEFYTSVGIGGDINCGAAGYQYKKDNFMLRASSGYVTNDLYKQNIGSAEFSSQLPLSINQNLGINMRVARRENLGDSVYFTNGIQGNFTYRLKIGRHINFQARNLFNTPSFNRTNQSLFELNATSCYILEKNKEICFSFENNKRVYNAGHRLKQMGNENKVDDYNYVIYYRFSPSSKINLKIGPWYKRLLFEEKTLSTKTDALNIYVEAKKEGRPGYSASLITGYRQKIKNFPFADGTATVNKSYGNVHFTGGLNGTFWGLNLQYDYGPPQQLSNIRDMDYWLIRISPHLQGDFFNEKLLCQINLDYTADWGRNYKYLNFRSSIDAILKNNWRLSFDGYVSTFGKLSLGSISKDLRLDLRISIRKDFNWSKKKNTIPNYSLDTYFFQDDNKNGIFDADEKGISSGFLKMAKKGENTTEKNVSISPVISDKSGKVTYANIPQGEYEMNISRIVNEDGYFNFSNSKQKVNLRKDTVCFIPFVKAYTIRGSLTITLANITSGKINSAKNIKITATDSKGQQFSALTDVSGHYMLPVAGKELYTISINNPYGTNVEVINNNSKVEFNDKDNAVVNFEFIERARKIRMKSASSTAKQNLLNVEKQENRVKNIPELKETPIHKSLEKYKDEFPLAIADQPKVLNPSEKIATKNTRSQGEELMGESKNENKCWIYNRISADGKIKKSYWIIGAFKSYVNAYQQIEKLKASNVDAKWIKNETNNMFYIYIKESEAKNP